MSEKVYFDFSAAQPLAGSVHDGGAFFAPRVYQSSGIPAIRESAEERVATPPVKP